jgi:hypothetical protein
VVPGATDDLIAVRKSKAPKAAAKHVTELPVLPNYEYELPVAAEEKQAGGPQLSADELKVRGLLLLLLLLQDAPGTHVTVWLRPRAHAGVFLCCVQRGCLVVTSLLRAAPVQ